MDKSPLSRTGTALQRQSHLKSALLSFHPSSTLAASRYVAAISMAASLLSFLLLPTTTTTTPSSSFPLFRSHVAFSGRHGTGAKSASVSIPRSRRGAVLMSRADDGGVDTPRNCHAPSCLALPRALIVFFSCTLMCFRVQFVMERLWAKQQHDNTSVPVTLGW